MGVDITQVYSPKRVNEVAEKFRLKPGSSLDLQNGWDFNRKADQRRACKKVMEEEPELIIGSPPCTMFSTLQELNVAMHRGDREWLIRHGQRWKDAVKHVEFCVRLYRHQLSRCHRPRRRRVPGPRRRAC